MGKAKHIRISERMYQYIIILLFTANRIPKPPANETSHLVGMFIARQYPFVNHYFNKGSDRGIDVGENMHQGIHLRCSYKLDICFQATGNRILRTAQASSSIHGRQLLLGIEQAEKDSECLC